MFAKHHAHYPERCLVLCFLCLGVASSIDTLHAQKETGTITGQLVDQNGGALSGARIAITNTGNDRTTIIVTDASGRYRVDLEPGTYSVRLDGGPSSRRDIANLQVMAGTIAEVVLVTAESRASIDTSSTPTKFNASAEEIMRLPRARSFQALTLMAPSANSGDIEGGLQINGASASENAFVIDGVRTNSLIDGVSRQNLSPDYVEQVQVATIRTAEDRGALGGTVSAVTRSGGDLFRGDAHYRLSSSALEARPVKRLVLDPADNTSVRYVQDAETPRRNQEPAVSFGGPIVRNRLWFFAVLSPTFDRQTAAYLFNSGKESGRIRRTNDSWQIFGKISHQTARTKADAVWLHTTDRAIGAFPVLNGSGANFISSSKAANEANERRGSRIHQVSSSASLSVMLWSAASATFRASYFRDSYKDAGIPHITSYRYQTPSSASRLPVPSELAGPAGTQNAPPLLQTLFDTTSHATASADYSHGFHLHGFHTLKGGFLYERSISQLNSSFPNGYVNVFWGGTFVNPDGSRRTGDYGYYEVNDLGLKGSAGGSTYSAFVQDGWRLNQRLSLNLGVRAEHEAVPSFRADIKTTAITVGWLEAWTPRLSAVYDVFGNARVRAFANWGRYDDWTKYQVARDSFGGKIWRTYYRAIDDPGAIVSVNVTNMPGGNIWQGPGEFRDNLRPNFDAIDPSVKPSSQTSMNAGVEFQLSSRHVLSAQYVRNNLERTIEDVRAQVDGRASDVLGNPGEGRARTMATSGATVPFPVPQPKRRYDALELSWRRRPSGNWFAGATYTLSRLYGNYAGLANSDEIRTPAAGGGYPASQQQTLQIAREGGNLNSSWDIDEVLWDSHGHLDVLGRLATDRPYVLKVFGSYTFQKRTTVGWFFSGASGTPLSTYLMTANQSSVFVEGRGDMGRTPFFTQTDVLVSHDLKMTRSKTLRFELNVSNLFNQKTVRHIFNYYNRGASAPVASSAVSLSKIDLANGYDYVALVAATADAATLSGAKDPRYGKPDLWNTGVQAHVSARFLF